MTTSAFSVHSIEPFPEIKEGAPLADTIIRTLSEQNTQLQPGDILVIASKVVSISESQHVDLATVTPSSEAVDLSAKTGKPAELVQLILDESTSHFLTTDRGPIIARHRLGHQLTSAGVDRAEPGGAWLLPADPDASARRLRDELTATAGVPVAVVIADSDGRPDRRGATVIAIGSAGISPLRITEAPNGKRQEETFTDMVAATAGIVLGQRGRGVPVAIVRGVTYGSSDDGVGSILHHPANPSSPQGAAGSCSSETAG
ncbi:coenzyme F420-0:L-glutamate ligase [Streptomyces sp. NPDC050485]|uniref:coenzyme F420-0:L-glutamate ligase n=1 Tax=Streptomyces sp. NPDC050485 TaxID=3365617 RepID=UPI0037AC9F56